MSDTSCRRVDPVKSDGRRYRGLREVMYQPDDTEYSLVVTPDGSSTTSK